MTQCSKIEKQYHVFTKDARSLKKSRWIWFWFFPPKTRPLWLFDLAAQPIWSLIFGRKNGKHLFWEFFKDITSLGNQFYIAKLHILSIFKSSVKACHSIAIRILSLVSSFCKHVIQFVSAILHYSSTVTPLQYTQSTTFLCSVISIAEILDTMYL